MDKRLEAVLRDAVECRCRPNIDDIDAQNILFAIEKLQARVAELEKDREQERSTTLAQMTAFGGVITKLKELLCCVETNLSKGMSKSMQRLQAETIREELK